MKVEIKEANQVKEREFPKLMKSENGCIVFFHSERHGTMLFDAKKQDLDAKVGIPWVGWSMRYFSDFDGSITLSNE